VRDETTLGGPQAQFPQTAWSVILSCADVDSPERREKINRLIQAYWRPVYTYLRAARHRTVEDAKDLTQEFFCRLLEGDFLKRFQPDRGRFRSFLKGSLKMFLAEIHRSESALKRGGGAVTFSLDVEGLETEEFLADLRADSPDVLFDRQWADEVMDRSLQALRKELTDDGKLDYLRVYENYVMPSNGDPAPTYESIARALNLSVYDVTNYLAHVRKRLRGLILENITEYVAGHTEAWDEFRELFTE
jgi:RNA polymerase sigma-70 factor (ECF subfamily)